MNKEGLSAAMSNKESCLKNRGRGGEEELEDRGRHTREGPALRRACLGAARARGRGRACEGAVCARGRGRAARELRALGAPGRREVAGKKSTTRAAAGAWKGLSLPSLPFSSLPFYSFPAQQARRRETHRRRDSSRACFFVPLRAPVSPLRRPPYASRRRPDA